MAKIKVEGQNTNAYFVEWQVCQEARLREEYRKEKEGIIKTLRAEMLVKPVIIDPDEEPGIETIITYEGQPSSRAAVAEGTRPTKSPTEPLFVYRSSSSRPEEILPLCQQLQMARDLDVLESQ
jgi:hypothetical protein